MHLDVKLRVQMLREMLRGIDRPMLSAGTSEANHQVGEAPVDITFHRGIYDLTDVFEEGRDLPVVFQEPDHGLIQSGEVIVTLVFPGIVDRPAIEHESAAVTARVIGDSFLVGEADHLHL